MIISHSRLLKSSHLNLKKNELGAQLKLIVAFINGFKDSLVNNDCFESKSNQTRQQSSVASCH